jgi:NAD(P)-dependent dehydrogenase (short-subunit alcohol dehydrogenase family)
MLHSDHLEVQEGNELINLCERQRVRLGSEVESNLPSEGGNSLNTLDQKVAIVTGGGSGIGRGVALALAQAGVRVVVCGRRQQPVEETARAIQKQAGQALAIQADVSQPEEVEKLVQATLQAFDTLDILINNAGISGGAPIHAHEIQDWERVMATNLRGPFLMARAVLPTLRAKHSGHIINISSESGLEYYPGDGTYGISKHALNAMGEYIQRENQDYNIRVNTICPGMVVSEMTQDAAGLDRAKCLYPEDIADLVLWLLTRRPNIKIGTPILIQTMLNPWE